MSAADPIGLIGQSVPRDAARRLAQGGGRYLGDIALPGLLHAAFLRSPYAHARILGIDRLAAELSNGVVAVFIADEVDVICTPWQGILSYPPGMTSPPQHALARDRVAFQGEPVAIVVASSRALAEDACSKIVVEWEPLSPVVTLAASLEETAPRAHPDLESNIAFESRIESGDAPAVFAAAAETSGAVIVEDTLSFSGITAVTMEPRGIIASFDAATGRLDLWAPGQSPFQTRDIVARHFGLSEADIAVHQPDVGGAFGLKLHVFSDEMATIAASKLLGRPVKFEADRLESFLSDVQARRQEVRGRVAFDSAGKILAMDVDVVAAAGAYSVAPRTSFLEPNQVARLCGGPYLVPAYAARIRSVFLNTAPSGQLRGVGHPIACAVTESLMDKGAAALGIGRVELRRRNLIPVDAYPYTSHGGFKFERLGQQEALDRLVAVTGPARETARAARGASGQLIGFGQALYVELTSPGVGFYGLGGAQITSRDSATLRLEPDGSVSVQSAITDQGQGGMTVIAQVVADVFGLELNRVRVVNDTTQGAPMGGGAWASRGASIAGEAAHRGAIDLRSQILALAAGFPEAEGREPVTLSGGMIRAADGAKIIELCALAQRVHYRPDLLGDDGLATLTATGTYYHQEYSYTFTQGAHAALVAIDPVSGEVTIDGFWLVADCGRVLNPLLADEQARGAAAMGIGAALWEDCRYGPAGDMETATMADYFTPMAYEMPDIVVEHMSTPTLQGELGAKGAGESGIAGVQAAILNAVNNALAPHSARISSFPITPEKVWAALHSVKTKEGQDRF